MTSQPIPEIYLSDEVLGRVAASLSDLYGSLYEERPVDPRSSLTGNMLAFVFHGGLSITDERLLMSGREERLREFRRNFFDVVRAEMVGVVTGLTGLRVNYSLFDFDPGTRTTHAVFVLDLDTLGSAAERRAVLNWSEQVRRNSSRLRAEHRETRERYAVLNREWHARREGLQRTIDEGSAGAARQSGSEGR